jgi:hypothetical protein
MQRLGFAPFRKKQNVLHFSRMTPISFELTLGLDHYEFGRYVADLLR